ncbi:MAG: BON domain-containing protein [Nitrospirae bacterium]|nr:MAG: BON domain-containing protein [Nitrospirota bacterium]
MNYDGHCSPIPGLFNRGCLLLVLTGIALCPPPVALSQSAGENAHLRQTELMKLVAGKSQIIDTPVPITRASIANPDVADTLVLSPKQLYVVGKQVGATNLTLWDKNGQVLKIYDLEIIPDLDRLRQQLHELLPQEHNVRIQASHDFVTLSGTVTSSAALKEILAIAEAYAPKKIINLLQVDRETSPPVVVDVIKGVTTSQVEF